MQASRVSSLRLPGTRISRVARLPLSKRVLVAQSQVADAPCKSGTDSLPRTVTEMIGQAVESAKR